MVTSYEPIYNPERSKQNQLQVSDPNWTYLEERDLAIKSRVRRLRVVIRILSWSCSYLPSFFLHTYRRVVVIALMTTALVSFYRTIDVAVHNRPLWPENTRVWPTYVTLAVAAINTILASIVLIAYFWGTKAANRWNLARTILTIGSIIFAIVIWAIAAASLKSTSESDGRNWSLWSATCDAPEDQKDLFLGKLNFNQFCLEQVPSILT